MHDKLFNLINLSAVGTYYIYMNILIMQFIKYLTILSIVAILHFNFTYLSIYNFQHNIRYFAYYVTIKN